MSSEGDHQCNQPSIELGTEIHLTGSNMCLAWENFTGMTIDKNRQGKTAPSPTAFSPFTCPDHKRFIFK